MINKTKIYFSILLSVVLVILGYKILKPKQNDHDYLKKLPQHIAELVEKKLAGEVKRFIAKDYSDSENRTYQDISGLITLHTLQQGDVSIYILTPEVKIDLTGQPLKATISFKAAMARGPKDASALNVIPESASLYTFAVNLEKTDDGWLVKSASWKQEGL